MQPEDADPNLLGFDPFDVTKVWPRDKFPVSPHEGSTKYYTNKHVDARVRSSCTEQEPGKLPQRC